MFDSTDVDRSVPQGMIVLVHYNALEIEDSKTYFIASKLLIRFLERAFGTKLPDLTDLR